MKRGHRPQRTCVGCGERDDKEALLRLVARDNGKLLLDKSSRGRGGYLHKNEACWKAFSQRRSVYRAFHLEIEREAREKLISNLRV